MKVINLLDHYNIPYVTEGHKHSREGWVNISCPFCEGHEGYHLGITLDGKSATCWRCGNKKVNDVLSSVLNITPFQVRELTKEYGGISYNTKEVKVKIGIKRFKYPSGTIPMLNRHKNYIDGRNFDPSEIERIWGVLGTSPVSLLDGIDYKHRILIPVYWNNKIVTFQCRDITNKHSLKYMACPQARELIHHKHILYGNTKNLSGTGIIVEGVTDVWRLGEHSFATFGIKYTPEQLRVISKNFTRVAVFYDYEPQAQKEALKLVSELKFRGVDAFNITTIDTDPGNMYQLEADNLVKQILK